MVMFNTWDKIIFAHINVGLATFHCLLSQSNVCKLYQLNLSDMHRSCASVALQL